MHVRRIMTASGAYCFGPHVHKQEAVKLNVCNKIEEVDFLLHCCFFNACQFPYPKMFTDICAQRVDNIKSCNSRNDAFRDSLAHLFYASTPYSALSHGKRNIVLKS